MSRKQITFTATFYGAERLTNSTNGNPRWKLSTSEGTYRTQSDASLGYDVDNHNGRPEHTDRSWRGREVEFTATPAGRVWDWKLAN